MNYIWGFMVIISIICGAVTGRIEALSNSVISGAQDAVNLIITSMGMMCLWTGLMKIADSAGITSFLAKLFSPILKHLFKDYPQDSPASRAICMNVTANLLGLGNAATPFGIKAMQEMKKANPSSSTANNSMVMFVVLNTASIQLIPAFLAVIRKNHGSQNPFDILLPLWIASICALAVGITAAKIFERIQKN